MPRDFTPGAQRALAAASTWWAPGQTDELTTAALLLGLVDEDESRAARLLADHSLTAEQVRAWAAAWQQGDADRRRLGRFSPALDVGLAAAEERRADEPHPLSWATEHLLLALALAGDEVAQWLAAHGLDGETLERKIDRIYGHAPRDAAAIPWPVDVSTLPERLPQTVPVESQTLSLEPSETSPNEQTAPHEQTAVLRILDASANRAREGLRVVEDYVRFALDDAHLTREFKELRHDLAAVLERFPQAAMLSSRDTRSDVGTSISTAAEQKRAAPEQVVAASAKRVEEALRSLEEYGKLVAPPCSFALEQLRYRMYTLERASASTADNVRRLASVRLYVLVDGRSTAAEFATLVESLVRAGVGAVQLRDKRLADRELVERARLMRRLTHGSNTLCIINDRADVAALVRAHGVHVGQDELTVKDARALVGPDALVGVSTHSIEQARKAVLDGASYVGVGPTFPSATKQFEAFPGLELVRAVSAEISLPAFAIGGVSLENLPAVLAAGARRVAVSSAITAAAEPAQVARAFHAQLNATSQSAR